MKKILYLLAPIAIGVALLASCKNGTKTDAAAKTDSVAMPYKASYSSSFTISDNQKNEQAVLQSYKDWEDNKLNNAPAYYADTVSWDSPTGVKLVKIRRDSMIHFFQKIRDSLSSVKIDVVAVTNLHSTDKNADWVGLWYKETDTYKTGKVDSAFYQDDNKVVNGKIVYTSSKRQVLKK
ncbi:MAG: hypothetical protein JWQ66_537 [Mucilaginibacter sp.]|nr:hypothetical protein [Mucilaginibacter sp.]